MSAKRRIKRKYDRMADGGPQYGHWVVACRSKKFRAKYGTTKVKTAMMGKAAAKQMAATMVAAGALCKARPASTVKGWRRLSR